MIINYLAILFASSPITLLDGARISNQIIIGAINVTIADGVVFLEDMKDLI